MNCSVCDKKAEPAYSVTHRCTHSSHVDCIEGEIDPFKCPNCLSISSFPSSSVSSKKRIEEPHLTDKNYIKFPGVESKGWMLASVGGVVSSLVSRGKPKVPPKKSALDLVKESVPIKDIFKEGYGLDHMLRDGVTIDHLLLARYKWEDLCLFNDISQNGPKRALDAFAAGPGLRMTANHLRDYPEQLPFEEFKKTTGLEKSQLCTVLGMEFPPDSSLQCVGDANWNAKDCVRLGLHMSDLIDFGLYCVQQYQDLMKGLSAKEQAEVEKQLKVTEAQLEGLKDLEEEQTQKTKTHQTKFIQEEVEEELEVEEESEEKIEEEPKKVGADSDVFRPRFRAKQVQPVIKKKNNLAHLGYIK